MIPNSSSSSSSSPHPARSAFSLKHQIVIGQSVVEVLLLVQGAWIFFCGGMVGEAAAVVGEGLQAAAEGAEEEEEDAEADLEMATQDEEIEGQTGDDAILKASGAGLAYAAGRRCE